MREFENSRIREFENSAFCVYEEVVTEFVDRKVRDSLVEGSHLLFSRV